jgi:hypothetical protein
MSLEAEARTALASIATANPAWSVAVVIGGTAGTGLDVGTTGASDFAEMGEAGAETGTVRVSSAAFTKPSRVETITVRGVPVTVLSVSGVALWVIQYRKVRPVEGV